MPKFISVLAQRMYRVLASSFWCPFEWIVGAVDAIFRFLTACFGSRSKPEHQPDRAHGTQGTTRAKWTKKFRRGRTTVRFQNSGKAMKHCRQVAHPKSVTFLMGYDINYMWKAISRPLAAEATSRHTCWDDVRAQCIARAQVDYLHN